MKKKHIITLLLLLSFSRLGLKAQQTYFANYLIIGSSFTCKPFSEYTHNQNHRKFVFVENTWNFNAGIRLSRKFFLGTQMFHIFTHDKVAAQKDYHAMYGLFLQYNLLRNEQHRLFPEISLNYGNFYSHRDDFLIHKNNVFHVGYGIGYDLPISPIKNLYLDLSFIFYSSLNNNPKKDLFTQYIIGLNYRINRQ